MYLLLATVLLLRMVVFKLSACEFADSAISQINLFSSNRICSGVPSLCSHCTHILMLIVLCYFHLCLVTLVVSSFSCVHPRGATPPRAYLDTLA